jgi:hypothetical protein
VARRSTTNHAVAQTEREWQQILRDKSVKIVRTKADWRKLLGSPDNPLANLDHGEVKKFTESLVFRNGGLAGAYYGPVEGLSYRQFGRLWGHFGFGMGLFAKWGGMRCVGPPPGTGCQYTVDPYICLPTC